jgi:hypothetical protein
MEEQMFSIVLLEEAAAGPGSIWVRVLVLGWFLLMTLVGWQVSRGNAPSGNGSQTPEAVHSDDNPSEFDTH